MLVNLLFYLILIASFVTTSKAPVTTSVALVTSRTACLCFQKLQPWPPMIFRPYSLHGFESGVVRR